MKNRQVSISIKYGPDVYKKNFMEQDALAYIDFLETSGLWYEMEEATDGEQPYLDEGYKQKKKDDINEQ
jgi:hypothetical protein